MLLPSAHRSICVDRAGVAYQTAQLIAAFDPEESFAILQPTFRGKQGNPTLWSREFLAAMLAISGDIGARHLAAKHADRMVEVEMSNDAVLRDFDTTEALKTAPEYAGKR